MTARPFNRSGLVGQEPHADCLGSPSPSPTDRVHKAMDTDAATTSPSSTGINNVNLPGGHQCL